MLKVTNKEYCSGCSSCANICPRNCIKMVEDKEGFVYPEVDQNDCVDCGLCNNVCHELHPYEKNKSISVYAAINKNEECRLISSSGGVFSVLAEYVISKGGVVFGARFDENWQVVIDYTEKIEGIKAFVGSKYVQARISTAYKDAKKMLSEGREVLFSGSPCQIAGLKHFLRREYDNLVTVDFVCHGVPSPKVWKRYLCEIKQKIDCKIQYINFRDKYQEGWDKYHFTIQCEGNNEFFSSFHWNNHYMKAFLSNMSLRPSCYQCMAKVGSSHSDLTMGDFWGINDVMPKLNDNKGVSLMLVNTNRGSKFIDNIDDINKMEVDSVIALKNNICYTQSVLPHPNRMHFFRWLDLAPSIVEHIEKELFICNESKVRDFFIKRKYELKLILYSLMEQMK